MVAGNPYGCGTSRAKPRKSQSTSDSSTWPYRSCWCARVLHTNRTDFIRTSIRNQLASHADAAKQSIVRHSLELGLRHYSREDLEAVKAARGKLRIQVVGLATIAEDVTPNSRGQQSSPSLSLALFRRAKRSRWRSLTVSAEQFDRFPTRSVA